LAGTPRHELIGKPINSHRDDWAVSTG
jgi:hypothetical protein